MKRSVCRVFILLICTANAFADVVVPTATDAPNGNDITWRLVGPGGGGWIQSIALDPRDPNIIYVGCDVGGFYFSSDGGRSYQIRNTGLRDYFIECIAVHPKNSTIIILGTESGIHRSTDQGNTWHWIRKNFPPVQRYSYSAPIGAVCFDPLRPNIVYAGIGRPRWGKNGAGAIYASDDAGETWCLISAGQLPFGAIVSDIEVKPDDSKTILAATSQGVYRSDDEGRTWKPSNYGLPHLYTEELAFAPSAPNVVYVSLRTTTRHPQPWNGGVFYSQDAGRTWKPANGPVMPNRVGRADQPHQMTSNIKELVVDPHNANVVYAGDRSWVSAGVWKSTDAGQHWQRATIHFTNKGRLPNMDYGWIRSWGPSVECMAISPVKPELLVFGTSGHVFISEDGGNSWQQRYCRQFPDGRFAGTGLEVTCVHRVIADPVRPQRLYFCYADIGLLITDDEGRTFRQSSKGMKNPGNCFTVVVDPQASNTIWAATGQWSTNVGDVCRSDDAGITWQVVGKPESGLPNGQTRHLVLDLKSPVGKRRLLVTSKENGIFESCDGGMNWRCINGNLPAAFAKQPCGLLLDPADSAHIIVALGGGGGIWDTRDKGTSWHRLNADEKLFWNITSLVADSRDFKFLYLGTREHYDHSSKRKFPGGVFKSIDGGKTWQMILDYHFVSAIAVSPTNPLVLYAATTDHPYHDNPLAEGLLKSADGGRTWRKENTGLSHINITCVDLNPHDPSLIYICTSGNSVFIGRDAQVQKKP